MGCAILSPAGCFPISSDAITPLHTTLHTRTFLGQLFRSGWAVGHQTSLFSPIPSAFSQDLLGLNLVASHDIEDLLPEFPSCLGCPSMSASLSLFFCPQKEAFHRILFFFLLWFCMMVASSPLPSSLNECILNHFASSTASQLPAVHSSLNISNI